MANGGRNNLQQQSLHLIESGRQREAAWALEPDNQYSVEEFYMRATDAQGHKEHIRVNVPPYIASQIAALVQSDLFPYQTAADLMRDAMYHRLHHLSSKKGAAGLNAVVARYRRESRLAAYQEELQNVGDFKASIIKVTDEALDKQDYKALRHELDQLMDDADNYREPFDADLKKLLRECYVRLARAEKKT